MVDNVIDNSGSLYNLTARIVSYLYDLNFIKDYIIYDDNDSVNEPKILNESVENNFSCGDGNISNNTVDDVNSRNDSGSKRHEMSQLLTQETLLKPTPTINF